MIAIEIEAPIINHRIEITNDRLPTNVASAKVIILYETNSAFELPIYSQGPLAEFRANPIQIQSFVPLSREEANAR